VSPYLAVLILVVIALIQTTVMPFAAFAGVRPMLPLLAVVSWGLCRSALEAAWWALAAGIALDALSGQPWGTYTVPLLAACAVVALASRRLHPTTILLPVAVVAGATIVFGLVQRLLLAMRGQAVPWSLGDLAGEWLLAVLLNLLWLPVLYFPLRAVARASRPRMDWER
jgi:rod shape-determining protein MreD